MSSFCVYCGRPLADGEVCRCTAPRPATPQYRSAPPMGAPGAPRPMNAQPAPRPMPAPGAPYGAPAPAYGVPAPQPAGPSKSFFRRLFERMGFYNPEDETFDAFETNKKIVPDCITPNDNEVPVKQYTVARLRSRILGIPYERALGKLQITNKRVLFRAAGRNLGGRTNLNHEFAIDEIAGMEVKRDRIFLIGDLLLSLIVAFVCMGVGAMVATLLAKVDSVFGLFFLSFLLLSAAIIPFFLLNKKWLVKAICAAAGVGTAFTAASALSFMNVAASYMSHSARRGGNGAGLAAVLLGIIGFVCFVLLIISQLMFSFKPNLVLRIKVKSAGNVIDLSRKTRHEENTGFTEIIPAEDIDASVKEAFSIITDIQKLGDFAIEKWKK